MASFNDPYTEQLQELLICAICLDHYQDPRLLPCSHTFCFQCIQKAVKNGNFYCPFKDGMKINQNDITQLPINRAVKDMVEFVLSFNLVTDKKSSQQCDNCRENQAINWCDKCAIHLCQSCTTSIHAIKLFQSHPIVPLVEKVHSFCMEHPDEKFKYWCKQCEVLVCRDCLLFQHKDHTFLPLKEAVSETKTKFQATAQETEEIKRNLIKFSETTNRMISGRHDIVRQEKQNIEETFSNLQRMLEERKLIIIKQLEDNELQTMKILDQQQNTIDQYLNLTIVQELCLKRMLDSNDQIQILKSQSTLSHNYKDFTEQYKKIDEGYSVTSHTFEKKNEDIEQVLGIISELGSFKKEQQIVKRDDYEMNLLTLDISKIRLGQTLFRHDRYSRGYQFSVKQPLRLYSICIKVGEIGQHVGFVINDAGVIISIGTVNSNDSTVKWLTIPLKCDIQNDYTLLVCASSDGSCYAYKEGDAAPRAVNQNCSVRSIWAHPIAPCIGFSITTYSDTSSLEMILNVEK